MKLGDYLIGYLKKVGVSHLFGIPGDLVINLFLKFRRPEGPKIITLSHDRSPITIKYIRASAEKRRRSRRMLERFLCFELLNC